MSEYEAAYLFKEMIDGIQNASINYLSVVFGFLVAGYLAAAQLSKVMFGIAVGLFSFFALVTIFILNRYMATATALVDHLRLSAVEGDTSLVWHPIIYQPVNFSEYISFIYSGLLLISFAAALVFFFHCRRGYVSVKI